MTAEPTAWWRRPELAGAAALAYALWSCRHLASAWSTSLFDLGGGVAFALWLLPLLACRRPPAAAWMFAGLGILGLGQLAELNSLRHLGLALLVAAWIRPAAPAWRWAWLAAAAAWMPWLGYALDAWPAPLLAAVRILLAAASLPLCMAACRQRQKGTAG